MDIMTTMATLVRRTDMVINRSQFQLTLKTQVFNKSNNKEAKRSKRFVFTLAALAVGAIILAGTTYGIFNYVELQKMEKDQNTIKTDATLIASSLQDTEHSLNKLGDQSNKRNGILVSQNIQFKMHRTLIRYAAQLTQGEIAIASASAIIAALAHHRAAPELIETVDLQKLASQVELQANQKGYVVLLNHAVDFLQCEASFLATDNGFNVFLHVPLARPDSVLQVYQHLPMPIPVHENLHLSVDTEIKFLAIDERKSKFLTMTAGDFAECQSIGKVFLCSNHNLVTKSNLELKTKDEGMCLFAIHTHQIQAIKRLCKWKVTVKQDQAIQLSPRQFVVYSQNPVQVIHNCPFDNYTTHRTQQLFGVQRVQVQPDCTVETASHILYGTTTVLQREWEVTWSWPHHLSDITGSLNFTAVNQLMTEKFSPLANRTQFTLEEAIQSLNSMGHKAPINLHVTSWLSLLSGISSPMLIGGLVCIFLLLKCRSTQTTPSASPASAPRITINNQGQVPTHSFSMDTFTRARNQLFSAKINPQPQDL
jgi:endonuclease V-like protein UPF0215 family